MKNLVRQHKNNPELLVAKLEALRENQKNAQHSFQKNGFKALADELELMLKKAQII